MNRKRHEPFNRSDVGTYQPVYTTRHCTSVFILKIIHEHLLQDMQRKCNK